MCLGLVLLAACRPDAATGARRPVPRSIAVNPPAPSTPTPGDVLPTVTEPPSATPDPGPRTVAPVSDDTIRVAGPADPDTLAPSETWSVCRLVSPNGVPGIGGADLGFSVLAPSVMDPDQLRVLFGDTWVRGSDACWFPPERSDDLQASLPAARPPSLGPGAPGGAAQDACGALEIDSDDPSEPTTWRPIRLFSDAGERSPDKQLDMTFLRTPVTGFSDGEHVFGVFLRQEPSRCARTTDCPGGSYCSTELGLFTRLGVCGGTETDDQPPTFCLRPSRCRDGRACTIPQAGVCMAEQPFGTSARDTPSWYQDDPRRAVFKDVYIASAAWPERPEDYAVGYRFATNRFINAAARTVSHFDPDDPSANDYRPGFHTLLMWGRPAFFTDGGAQAPLYLLYQPLAGLLQPDGSIRFAPRFFAGYDPQTGAARWSDKESDAQPVYRPDVDSTAQDDSQHDGREFDVVNHGAMTWVEPLQRWVMFYGGSVPDWMRTDLATGLIPAVVNEQPVPAAIHMRTAAHPFGRSRGDAPMEEAWSQAIPVVRPDDISLLDCDSPEGDPAAGCTIPRSAEELVSDIIGWAQMVSPEAWTDLSVRCLLGNLSLAYLYGLTGSTSPHLYGANIIEEWTEDVTDQVPGVAPDERAVEIYWNVSTWQPYQVLLMKTQIRARVMR